MEQLKIFEYNNQEVRTIMKEGEPWFVAKDVCDVFGETNRNRAMQSLDEDEKGYTQMYTPGGMQKISIVNESGLYALLFAMQPSKARGVEEEYIINRERKLKNFKRFVTKEILPSIRKHGAYITPDKMEELISNPDLFIKLITELKNEKQQKKKLIAENSVMKPKAEYFDELVDRNLLTNFRDTAKALKVKETDFIQFLLEEKYVYRNSKGKLLPYAEQNNNLFEIKETMNPKNNWTGVQTLITPKGRETFRLLLKQDSCINAEYEDSQAESFEGQIF